MKAPILFIASLTATLCIGMSSRASAQTCAPPWQVGMSVTTGQLASFPLNNVSHNWKALQAETQAQSDWTPPNVPALWTDQGTCSGTGGGGGGCTVAPGAPTGLTSSAITTSGVTLSWTAPAAPTGCSVSGYTILQNGTSIGTSTTTSFNVTGLAAGTSFNFTV